MNLKIYKEKWKRGIRRTFFRGNERLIDIGELKKMQNVGAIVLDVRSSQEYKEYHLEGSVNIPLYELCCKIENTIRDKNKEIVVYCQSGGRSKKAVSILNKKGYCNIYELCGGLDNI